MNYFLCTILLFLALVTTNASIGERSNNSTCWSRQCPSPSVLATNNGINSKCCCSIIDYGAIGDNSTLNTIAIQSTIDGCHEMCVLESSSDGPAVAIVYVPKGMFRTGSLSLKSNTRLHIAKGASIYGSDEPGDYPVVPMLPNGYETGKAVMFRALISAYNVENISVTGENDGYPPGSFAQFSDHNYEETWSDASMSVIDGVGWKWWCKSG